MSGHGFYDCKHLAWHPIKSVYHILDSILAYSMTSVCK